MEKRSKEKKGFYDQHKKAILIALALFCALLIMFFIIYFIMPAFSKNKYGHRLDGINEHQISSSTINEIKDKVSSEEGVNKITYTREGRILNFIIKFDDGYNIDTAKKIGESITENIKNKDLKYYDIQVFLDSESKDFPAIGYKSKQEEKIKWGKSNG